jgi:hypothetical protein
LGFIAAYSAYLRAGSSVVRLQAVARGRTARLAFLRTRHACVMLQRWWRWLLLRQLQDEHATYQIWRGKCRVFASIRPMSFATQSLFSV